ncbi:hypothetical protein N0V90_007678 [Kalmusia sp. IMI 367209]|nr:hypothetical protein N0V90_007678 [Kalmusia sp. IMI 367209]
MSYIIILGPILGSFVYLVYALILHPLFFSPLSRIPFAHPLAITPWWIKYHRRNGSQALRIIRAAHERYGPIVRLTSTEVSLNSYEGGHKIYVERGGFAKPMCRNLVSMVGGPNDKAHAGRKRDMGNIYSKSLLVISPHLRTIASTLLSRLTSELDRIVTGEEKGVTDVFNLNGAVNADFAAAYLFGLRCGTQFIADREKREVFFRQHGIFLGGEKGYKAAQRWVEKYMLERCEAAGRVQEKHEKNEAAVVYGQLTNRGVLGNDLASEVLDHLIAGSEAPRTICTYMQWELSRDPTLQARLRQELQTLSLPSSTELVPDLKALDALPLLDAILTETLRVYTVTPGPQWRIVPPEGTTLHGVFIPGGVIIHVSLGVLHRNENVFPDCGEWKPERWLIRDQAKLDQMRRNWWPFNKGPRVCIGKDFTLLVMKLFMATVYARYNTSVVGDNDMRQDDKFLGQPEGKSLVLRFERV